MTGQKRGKVVDGRFCALERELKTRKRWAPLRRRIVSEMVRDGARDVGRCCGGDRRWMWNWRTCAKTACGWAVFSCIFLAHLHSFDLLLPLQRIHDVHVAVDTYTFRFVRKRNRYQVDCARPRERYLPKVPKVPFVSYMRLVPVIHRTSLVLLSSISPPSAFASLFA